MTTSPSPSPLRTVTLYKTEGSSDKVYGLSIVPAGELFSKQPANTG